MSERGGSAYAVPGAAVCACLMMIHQVGAKALRDALFLSSFESQNSLPLMMVAAGIFAILLAFLASIIMARVEPGRFVPVAFTVSAAVYLGLWRLGEIGSRLTAVSVYLLTVGVGALLTSGFWSVLNELFDPHELKKYVGRIAGGGSLGIILAGLAGTTLDVSAMFPLLAALHVGCAGMILLLWRSRLGGATPGGRLPLDPDAKMAARSVLRIIREAPYLQTLAVLVLLGTVGGSMIDLVFRDAAKVAGDSSTLFSIFSLFYAGVGVVTFLMQTFVSYPALKKLGVARTMAALPLAVVLGGFGAMLGARLIFYGAARAVESISRSSLFRSGYELFYAPIPVQEKRAAKQIIDVGFDRLGEALAGGLVALLFVVMPTRPYLPVLTVAVLLALVGLAVAVRIQEAYLGVLEKNLRHRAGSLDLIDFSGSILSSMTLLRPASLPEGAEVSPLASSPAREPDDGPRGLGRALDDLGSEDPSRVARVLMQYPKLDPGLVPQTIHLLGVDSVYAHAVRALRVVAPENLGQLVDALLSTDQDVAVRRRIPRVLSRCPTQRAANGLLMGLDDKSFEVRYQCGRALAAIRDTDATITVDPLLVFKVVRHEASVGQKVWAGCQILDTPEKDDSSGVTLRFLRDRSNRCLEHVFTLLSLVLPKEPLRVAFHGLHADDQNLRGTALEDLDTALPPDIRTSLWPYLNDQRKKDRRGISSEEALEKLMRSQESIMLNLEEIQKRRAGPDEKSDPSEEG